MAVILDWYDATHTIFIRRFFGHWTIEESIETTPQFKKLVQDTAKRYDGIADFLQASYTPPTGLLWEWMQAATQRHVQYPHWGLSVIVTSSNVLKAYIAEGIKSTPAIQQHYQLTTSIEDAVRIIQADRARATK